MNLMILISGCCKPTYELREKFIEENISIANAILIALEKHMNDHDSYPAELDDLTPLYIKNIPTTTDIQSYKYRLHDSSEYSLTFLVTPETNLSCTYFSRLEGWDCSFGSDHRIFP